MATLIVDDETKTREALRNLLIQLGHTTILEARNGEEALKITDSEKSRIQMIIADWEMPYMDGLALAKKIGERSYLDLAPYLLITSDLSRSQLATYKKQIPRLDYCLLKPFRTTTLYKAMNQAYVERCNNRNQILYIGNEPPDLDFNNGLFFKSSVDIQSLQETNRLLGTASLKIGAVAIDPNSFSKSEKAELGEILSAFKKTPIGTATPLACLSREPKDLFHFRIISRFFFDKPSKTLQSEGWRIILTQIGTRILTGWEIELLFHDIKGQIQQKDFTSARKTMEMMLKLDRNHPEIYGIGGDIFENLGLEKEAIEYYQKALQLNPTLMRPYVKLIKLLSAAEHSHDCTDPLFKIVESAIQYCPQNPDILLASARIFLEAGNIKKSKELIETVLHSHPRNIAAQSLLKQIPC